MKPLNQVLREVFFYPSVMVTQDTRVSSGQSLKENNSEFSVLLTYLYLHMAEKAKFAETASFLPEGAHGFIAHSRLTVSKWATVSLQKQLTEQKHYSLSFHHSFHHNSNCK